MKNLINSICILIFFLFQDGIGQEKQLSSALNDIYNFNFTKAFSSLNNISTKYPKDHRSHYYKSLIYSWFYLGSLNEAYRDSFEYYSDKTLSILNRNIDDEESERIEKVFWTGMVYYNKSVVNARANQYASSIISLNEMRKNLLTAINSDSSFIDAYLALGLSNFAFAEVPAALKWAANLVGFDSDKESGLRYVQLVADKGKILKTDAKFYLSQIYSRVIIDYEQADKILTALTKSYPKNLLFNYSLAWVKNETGQLNNSEKILNKIVTVNDTLFSYVISNSHLLLGNILFTKQLYDSALTHYTRFRELRANNDYLGLANLRTGMCLEMSGDRKNAVKWYEMSDEGNEDIEEDIYAKKLGKQLVSRPITKELQNLLRFESLLKQKNYNEIEKLADIVLSDEKSTSRLKAAAYLYLSEALLKDKKFQEALELTLTGLKLNQDDKDWITNFLYYNSALALFNLQRENETITYLKKIENNTTSDFYTTLKNKVYTLQRKIDKLTG